MIGLRRLSSNTANWIWLASQRPSFAMRTYNETIVENAKLFKTSKKDREFYELKNTYGDYDEAKKI